MKSEALAMQVAEGSDSELARALDAIEEAAGNLLQLAPEAARELLNDLEWSVAAIGSGAAMVMAELRPARGVVILVPLIDAPKALRHILQPGLGQLKRRAGRVRRLLLSMLI